MIERAIVAAWRWLSNEPPAEPLGAEERERLDWVRVAGFTAVHVSCLLVLVVGVSPVAIVAAGALYLVRMFAITAFYHRYFSHRAFRTSRSLQLVMAVVGCTAGQRGPLWWAGHHREHHATADTPNDPHSPTHRGFIYSHMLWFLTRGSFALPSHRVRDWLRWPELRTLERFDWIPFVALGVACYLLGSWLHRAAPELGTTGPQMLVWAFFVSTVVLYHATYTINSLAHCYGTRRYDTRDDSRNNVWLALLTLGEGWHNNHHYCPTSARQGFHWWEIDMSWIALRALASLGLVRDLKSVPAHMLAPAGERAQRP